MGFVTVLHGSMIWLNPFLEFLISLLYTVDLALSMLESQCWKNHVALNIQHMTFHTIPCFTLVISSFFYSRDILLSPEN